MIIFGVLSLITFFRLFCGDNDDSDSADDIDDNSDDNYDDNEDVVDLTK